MNTSKLIRQAGNSNNYSRNAGIWFARSHRASRFLALLLVGLLVISLQSGYRAGWIAAKAGIAQVLLMLAWEQSKALQRAVKPWPWMDTHPVARLTIDSLGETLIVLSGSSGEAMAFGPSHISLPFDHVLLKPPANSSTLSNPSSPITATLPTTATPGLVAIGGHRDTHLRFLQFMQTGDTFSLETADGLLRNYMLESAQIVDTEKQEFLIEPRTPGLLLVTCYPFDSLSAGGPLRLVAFARDVTANSVAITPP